MTTYCGSWMDSPSGLVACVNCFEDQVCELFELTSDRVKEMCPGYEGFGWGYVGQGSHALAIALLLDATNDPYIALNHYRAFTLGFLFAVPLDGFRITSDEIRQWAAEQASKVKEVAV